MLYAEEHLGVLAIHDDPTDQQYVQFAMALAAQHVQSILRKV